MFPWITRLIALRRIPFPDRDRDTVMSKLLELAVVPPLEVDDALQFEERRVLPRIGLRVTQQREAWGEEYFQAHLLLDYGRGWSEPAPSGRGIWYPEERVYLVRDTETESAAQDKLRDLGLRPAAHATSLRLPTKIMPRAVRELLRG